MAWFSVFIPPGLPGSAFNPPGVPDPTKPESFLPPGATTIWKAAEDISNGRIPMPMENPLPDGVQELLPDRFETVWDEHVEGNRDLTSGLLQGSIKAGHQIGMGVADIFNGHPVDGFKHIVDGSGEALATGVGAGLIDFRKNVSGVQVLIGLEQPGRPLNAEERALLVKVFGNQIDLSQIRIKEGPAGIANINDRPFTSGNTIYLKKNPDEFPGNTPEERRKAYLNTLVHEATHVWQFQKFGPAYQVNSLAHQCYAGCFHYEGTKPIPAEQGSTATQAERDKGRSYNWMIGAAEGKKFNELSVEAQAQLIEYAEAYGFFETPDKGVFVDDQGKDWSAYLREAIKAFRAGNG